MNKVAIAGFIFALLALNAVVECQLLVRSIQDPQAANPMIKMGPWVYGNHEDEVDDSEDPDVVELRKIDDQIEELAVRCGGKKKGKKGKWGR